MSKARGNERRLRIGISACSWAADPMRPIFNGRPLIFLEESLSHFVQRAGCLPYMLPPPLPGTDPAALRESCAILDGLILHGGIDICPQTYGEEPLKPEWAGDPHRDAYELALISYFMAEAKPILGICRGNQILNVSLGGSLYQDIASQYPQTLRHRDSVLYERNHHGLTFTPGGVLASAYGSLSAATINSVHHQAIKTLGRGLTVEARSSSDGVIEAIALTRTQESDPWCMGVQWHPEFQEPEDKHLLDPRPLMEVFCAAISASLTRRAST